MSVYLYVYTGIMKTISDINLNEKRMAKGQSTYYKLHLRVSSPLPLGPLHIL